MKQEALLEFVPQGSGARFELLLFASEAAGSSSDHVRPQ